MRINQSTVSSPVLLHNFKIDGLIIRLGRNWKLNIDIAREILAFNRSRPKEELMTEAPDSISLLWNPFGCRFLRADARQRL